MISESPLVSLSHSLGHAEFVGFPAFEHQVTDYGKPVDPETKRRPTRTETRRPTAYEITVVAMFPQQWSSTALGFGGIGGQAFTTAYTVVLCGPMGDHLVYFGGRFAYRVARPNAQFFEDIASSDMADVRSAGRYESARD